MRSVFDMVAGRDTPTAPGFDSQGRVMADLDSRQCRFPLGGEGAAMRFCAVDVGLADWLPGKSLGSYCQFHRTWLRGLPSVAVDEAA